MEIPILGAMVNEQSFRIGDGLNNVMDVKTFYLCMTAFILMFCYLRVENCF